MIVMWMHCGSGLNHENESKIWTFFPFYIRQGQFSLVWTFLVPFISEICIKINLNFYFNSSMRCVKWVKPFKAFKKPFEVPQRSVKKKFELIFSFHLVSGRDGLNGKC